MVGRTVAPAHRRSLLIRRDVSRDMPAVRERSQERLHHRAVVRLPKAGRRAEAPGGVDPYGVRVGGGHCGEGGPGDGLDIALVQV